MDKVVVIPLGGSKHLKSLITVSANGGDFKTPAAALASIGDASEINPYVVYIGPGVYTLATPLAMKPYVTIAGAGENDTILTGAISSGNIATAAIVTGADNATLRDLTIKNTGGGPFYSIGICNDDASPLITNVTVMASGGGETNMGVYNYHTHESTMTNMTASATGGAFSYGVVNTGSLFSTTMTNVKAQADGGTINNYGIYNLTSASVTMTDVTAIALGSASSTVCGLLNANSSLTIQQSNLITGSVVSSTHGLCVQSGTVRVLRSSIIGGASNTGGTLTCANSDNGVASTLSATCLPMIVIP